MGQRRHERRQRLAVLGASGPTIRALRDAVTVPMTIGLVIAMTAFVVTAIPRYFERLLDDEIRYRIHAAPAPDRNLSASLVQQISGSSAPIEDRMREKGTAYVSGLDPQIQVLISDTTFVLTSPEFGLQPLTMAPGPIQRSLQLRYQSDIDGHIDLVEGHLPTARSPVAPASVLPEGQALPGGPRELVPVFETALSVDAAHEFGVAPGDRFLAGLGSGDDVTPWVIEVSGLFTIRDTTDAYWFGDDHLAHVEVRQFGDLLSAVGILAPEAYQALLEVSTDQDWTYGWRFFLNADAITAQNYPSVAENLRQLQVTKGPTDAIWANPQALVVTTRLPQILSGFESQASFTLAVIALAAIGVLGVALAAVGVLAALFIDRQRFLLYVLGSRGATWLQLTVAEIAVGLLICLPATAIGYIASAVLLPGYDSRWSLWAAGLTGIGATALIISIAQPIARQPLETSRSAVGRRTTGRRAVFEGFTIALAIVGVLLLRQRGLRPDPSADGVVTFDPLLAAVPVLLALAVSVLVLRFYPLPIRIAARAVRRSRGVVLFVGLRRITGQAAIAHLPLLVMSLAVGVAVFATVIVHSVSVAQDIAAWHRVGADYRIEAQRGRLPAALDVATVTGVTATAEALSTNADVHVDARGSSGQGNDAGVRVRFVALDVERYRQMSDLRTASLIWDALAPFETSPSIGTRDNPLPAIISTRWAPNEPPLAIGDAVTALIDTLDGSTLEVTLTIVATTNSVAGFPSDQPFMLTSLELLRATVPDRDLQPTTLFVAGAVHRGDLEAAVRNQAIPAGLREILRQPSININVLARADEFARLSQAPLVRGVVDSFRASMLLVAIYASIAAVTTLILGAGARQRDLSYLRTLGLSQNQGIALTAIEQLPSVILACCAGVPLGALVARAVRPGIGLDAIAGGIPVTMQTDWILVVAVVISLAALVTFSVIITSIANRRAQLGQVLRVG